MKDDEHNPEHLPATIDELHDQIAKQSAKIKETKTTLVSLFWGIAAVALLVFMVVDFSMETLLSTKGILLMASFGIITVITLIPAIGIHAKQMVEDNTKLKAHRAQLFDMLNEPEGGELTIAKHEEHGQLTEAQQQGELSQKSSNSR